MTPSSIAYRHHILLKNNIISSKNFYKIDEYNTIHLCIYLPTGAGGGTIGKGIEGAGGGTGCATGRGRGAEVVTGKLGRVVVGLVTILESAKPE